MCMISYSNFAYLATALFVQEALWIFHSSLPILTQTSVVCLYINQIRYVQKHMFVCEKIKSRKYILMIAAIPFKGRIITKPQNGEMYIWRKCFHQLTGLHLFREIIVFKFIRFLPGSISFWHQCQMIFWVIYHCDITLRNRITA